jgi:putative FmdB family regulatory protein
MPIYDFQCTSCSFKDELLRKSSDAGTILCPKCSQETFSKMLSAPSFQLNGSGWYATDFKDKKVTKSDDSAKTSAADAPAANCAPGCACH